MTENLWATEKWQLNYNNAPTHYSHLIHTFLAKHNIPVLHQTPDITNCDFFVVPKAEENDEPDLNREYYVECDGLTVLRSY